MPAYVEFHGSAFPSFSGGVTVGAHAGWSRLQSVELLGWKPASGAQAGREPGAPGINEIVMTKVQDCASATRR
jgi:glucose/arabinose dehydrogenase